MLVLSLAKTAVAVGGVMPGETSPSPVLERLQADVGEWITHGTSDGCPR